MKVELSGLPVELALGVTEGCAQRCLGNWANGGNTTGVRRKQGDSGGELEVWF